MKVAVYGSLLKGFYNYDNFLKGKSEYVGSFQTDPIFNLIDMGTFPALTKEGSTSISMEVFDIDDIVLGDLDSLEGYNKGYPEKSFYNREKLSTPYGDAYYYVFNGDKRDNENIITSGNWRNHKLVGKR